MISGNSTQVWFDNSTGRMKVSIVAQTLQFEITACGGSSILAVNCVSSGTLSLEVREMDLA